MNESKPGTGTKPVSACDDPFVPEPSFASPSLLIHQERTQPAVTRECDKRPNLVLARFHAEVADVMSRTCKLCLLWFTPVHPTKTERARQRLREYVCECVCVCLGVCLGVYERRWIFSQPAIVFLCSVRHPFFSGDDYFHRQIHCYRGQSYYTLRGLAFDFPVSPVRCPHHSKSEENSEAYSHDLPLLPVTRALTRYLEPRGKRSIGSHRIKDGMTVGTVGENGEIEQTLPQSHQPWKEGDVGIPKERARVRRSNPLFVAKTFSNGFDCW